MTIPQNAVHKSLANARRRHVITYLQDTDDQKTSLADLVDYVVEQETHSPAPERKKVRIDLYHAHLPLLVDTGVIEFDRCSETVRYRSHDEVEAQLDIEKSKKKDTSPEWELDGLTETKRYVTFADLLIDCFTREPI